MSKIKITTPFIKLDSLLKFSTEFDSGSSAKEAILNGEVTVNGEVCLMRGKKIYNGDKIKINNEIEIEVE